MNFFFIWRKLHALGDCKRVPEPYGVRDEWYIDVGYCLDRYHLIDSELK